MATEVQPRFWLHTNHKPELLFAMMRAFANEDARISFEGQLSHTQLAKIAGASFSETQVLRRNTTWPRMDFLILPLTPTTVTALEKAVVSNITFKGNRGIVHVQIEKQGHLVFVACDQFHEDCVWVSSDISASVLEDLVEKRVLHSYKSP
jgi:hypothetical protein